MYCIKSLLCTASLGVILVLELAIVPSTASSTVPSVAQDSKPRDAQPKQSNPPPPPDNPDSSASGGRRDKGACPQDAVVATTSPILTAFSPTTKPGLTLAERPTFLVYVPKTSAKTAEFSLRNQNGSGVYRTTLALTNTPDTVSISLASKAPSLEIGKRYTWSFAVICNPNDRVEDQFVTGTVERIELAPTRLRQIEQASPKERISLYQKANIWYEPLTILFELRRTQPNDPSIRAAWGEFLQSGGVDAIIDSKLQEAGGKEAGSRGLKKQGERGQVVGGMSLSPKEPSETRRGQR